MEYWDYPDGHPDEILHPPDNSGWFDKANLRVIQENRSRAHLVGDTPTSAIAFADVTHMRRSMQAETSYHAPYRLSLRDSLEAGLEGGGGGTHNHAGHSHQTLDLASL